MPARRWLLSLAVMLFACRCAPVVTPAPDRATPRTAYVQDGAALIASPDARAALVERIAGHQLSGVAPYQLAPLLVDAQGRTRIAGWIDEVHRAGAQVIVPVAGRDRIAALARVVAEHPGTWIDGVVTELEYWNQPDRATGLTALVELLDALIAAGPALAPGRTLRIGAYLGYPTAPEAAELATRLDFVHLDYSVASPRDAWPHVHAKGGPLRERYAWFAQAGVEVWPIFYATGEVDMAASLTTLGLAGVEARFRADLAADPAYGQLAATGFAYFTLEAVPPSAWGAR